VNKIGFPRGAAAPDAALKAIIKVVESNAAPMPKVAEIVPAAAWIWLSSAIGTVEPAPPPLFLMVYPTPAVTVTPAELVTAILP